MLQYSGETIRIKPKEWYQIAELIVMCDNFNSTVIIIAYYVLPSFALPCVIRHTIVLIVIARTLMAQSNTFRPRQNGRHFSDDISRCNFLKENVCISFEITLKFVPKSPINNISALVQIMAWRRPGDKPLSETMMINLLTHICVARPQWVESSHYWQRMAAGMINVICCSLPL